MSKPVLLYAHPSMDGLATAIVKSCEQSNADPTHLVLSQSDTNLTSTPRRCVCYKRQGIKWDKFRDGFPNLFIDNVKNVAGRDVIFLGSFHTPEVIFEQLSVIYAMPRYLARSFTFILPYFPTGTMERVDTEGQVATAKTLAQLLSSTPLTARGPSQIVIFDIHALQERFYFADTIIPRLETAIPLLKAELSSLTSDGRNKFSVAFPDDGAFKRFHLLLQDMPSIVCAKVRDGTTRQVVIREGDAKGFHVVIVDDLVQTGGTLIECAKALLAAGATHISAYVTHAVFPNKSWQQFVDSTVKFEQFWITDSIPHAAEISTHPPFKLLSLGRAIADTLLGYDLIND